VVSGREKKVAAGDVVVVPAGKDEPPSG